MYYFVLFPYVFGTVLIVSFHDKIVEDKMHELINVMNERHLHLDALCITKRRSSGTAVILFIPPVA